jgi:hypothetical protein
MRRLFAPAFLSGRPVPAPEWAACPPSWCFSRIRTALAMPPAATLPALPFSLIFGPIALMIQLSQRRPAGRAGWSPRES